MKLPLSWLRDYVDFEDSVEGLSDRLTFAGLEVESIETIGGTFDGIVAGRVVSIEPHPNADKLRLCTVEYGANEPLQVVCGAPNVQAEAVYPFAPVGTELPSGLKLKKAKIRGIESLGMLCAPDELGLSGGHSGLMTLNPGTKPGTPLSSLLGPPETVFELEITPNRPDCLSIIGVAREIAALYNRPLNMPAATVPEMDSEGGDGVSVEIRDPVQCPRYTARVFKNVVVGPSPDWMKRRLEACGIRPINNVVDITNYVMLETGHPLHAFDLRQIEGEQIIVRRAHPGERFITLDGEQRTLSEDMLVISDTAKTVALAGVMGGENSGIDEGTTTVLLESATFEPGSIRATAKVLGLHTDSSYRFQRGVNADSVDAASRRAASLLCELAGATPSAKPVDAYPSPKTRRRIAVRRQAVCDLIGLDIPAGIMDDIFRSIAIDVVASDENTVEVDIPTFRDDLEREVDLIEEVSRLYGVDRIPEKTPLAETVPGAHDDRWREVHACRRILTGLGAREIMNYTLVNHSLLDLFGTDDRSHREELPHPISTEQSVLRTSLIPQMVESLGRNRSRQIKTAVFFEAGRTFEKTSRGPVQSEKICIGMMGPCGRGMLDHRRAIGNEEAFLWMKGMVEQLFAARQLPLECKSLDECGAFEAGQAIALFSEGKPAGCLGLIHSRARKEWRLTDPVAVAELTMDSLLAMTPEQRAAGEIPLFPSIERDFAFVVNESVWHEEIVRVIQTVAPKELEKVELFDIFRGKALGPGKKSLAYSFIYRSPVSTLTDEAVNRLHDAIGQAVCAAVDGILRE